MGVTLNPNGFYRAYKKINGVEHQLYSTDKAQAEADQEHLDKRAKLSKSLRKPVLFSSCGRMRCLRIIGYKGTSIPTFLLQVSVNRKQKRTQRKITKFEASWNEFYKLWREYFGLTIKDAQCFKEEIQAAKKLYVKDFNSL